MRPAVHNSNFIAVELTTAPSIFSTLRGARRVQRLRRVGRGEEPFAYLSKDSDAELLLGLPRSPHVRRGKEPLRGEEDGRRKAGSRCQVDGRIPYQMAPRCLGQPAGEHRNRERQPRNPPDHGAYYVA